MKQPVKNRIKAAFLLTVFALNTVVGFACSVGLDMGFNTRHHRMASAAEPAVHRHEDGKQHIHQAKKQEHHPGQSHHDNTAKAHHGKEEEKGNCCTDDVKQFQDLAKAVPSSSHLVHPVFFTAFVATFFNGLLVPYTDVVKDIKPFVRSYHPPIPDIRIAIQSFLI